METQKIVNLLNSSENECSKFATKKWYVIDSETRIKSLRLFWCIYFIIGNIAVVGANNNTKVTFKNWAPFRKCRTAINEIFIDKAEHINIAMPTYNLI